MDRFLADAASILETGLNVLSSGHEPSDLVILTGVDGQNQLLAECDWPLESLRLERGATCAYRVSSKLGTVVVEGAEYGRRCRLEQSAVRSLTGSGRHRLSGPGP
jgi:hypothetical protein